MLILSTLAVVFLAQNSVLGAIPAKRSYDTHNYYVLEHEPQVNSGASLADVARSLGVEVVEQVGELPNHWLVRVEQPSTDLVARGESVDPVLDTFENLRSKSVSRLSPRSFDEDSIHAGRVVNSVRHLSRQVLRQRVRRAPPLLRPPTSIKGVAQKFDIHDPLFPKQWHLVNEEYPEHMMNVTPVWEMGFTGKGVISSVIDDGLDYTSDDLAPNFVRCEIHTICLYLQLSISMQKVLTILMTTSSFPIPRAQTIIMVPAAQGKLLPPRITFVVLALHTSPK